MRHGLFIVILLDFGVLIRWWASAFMTDGVVFIDGDRWFFIGREVSGGKIVSSKILKSGVEIEVFVVRIRGVFVEV